MSLVFNGKRGGLASGQVLDAPPMLYPAGASINGMTGRWWVAHTKARCEKAFARDCLNREIGYFLPMCTRTIYCSGRKRHSLVPIFNGYVFFAGDDQARYEALVTDRLCQVIPVVDQSRLIAELSDLQRALEGELKLDLYPFAAVGRRCRIRCGAMMGLEGVVVRREDGATRLVLQVSILGQGAAVEVDVDAEWLEGVE